MATVATNIYAYGVPAWKEADNQHTYNPEYARQLLAEAGYPDGVTLDLYIVNTTASNEAAEILVNSCAEGGITLNVIAGDAASMSTYMMNSAPGFYLQVLYTNGDPYIMLSSLAGSFYGNILGYEKNEHYAEACDILSKAMSTIDETERIGYYQQLMQISYDNCYTVSLLDLSDIAVHPDGLEGFWMGGPVYHYEDCVWKK